MRSSAPEKGIVLDGVITFRVEDTVLCSFSG